MSDQDQEANRAKQLEEARKRVEELKKRSKKSKKKGKKSAEKNQDVQPTESVEGSETGVQEEGSELEESRGSIELELLAKDVQVPEGESIQAEESLEPELSKKELSQEQGTQTPETQVDAEGSKEKSGHSAQTSGDLQETPTDREKSSDMEKHEASQKGTEELFGGESSQESDFLATIQKEREQSEIEELRNQLEKASLENKKLKFVNMDQETEIEELQNEISLLKQKLEGTEQQLAAALQSQEKEKSSRTSSQYAQQIDFASFSNLNAPPQSRPDETNINQVTVNRAALDKWRNWNVDMTTWRSIGSGPIVEF